MDAANRAEKRRGYLLVWALSAGDARGSEYTARYRSSYVWIFTLTALSLLSGAIANFFHKRDITIFGHIIESRVSVTTFAGIEFFLLSVTFCIAVLALRRDWHEHSIEIPPAR